MVQAKADEAAGPMISTRLKPMFSYFGAKWRLAPKYPGPRYGTIIELFAGSACYSLTYPDHNIILVEKDPIVAALWRYLISVSVEEIWSLPDLYPGQTVDDLKVIPEVRTLVGFWISKGAVGPSRIPSPWMFKHADSLWWGPRVKKRLADQVGRIRHWKILEIDWKEAPVQECTYFIDPPYFKAGHKYRTRFSDYGELSFACQNLPGQVIVCEADGAVWLPFRPFYKTPALACNKNISDKWSQEVIWTNTEQIA